jgi:hypothetical protein
LQREVPTRYWLYTHIQTPSSPRRLNSSYRARVEMKMEALRVGTREDILLHSGVNLGPVALIGVFQISGRFALISVVSVRSLFDQNSVRKYSEPIRCAALIWRRAEWFGCFGRTDLALPRAVPKILAHRLGPATNCFHFLGGLI